MLPRNRPKLIADTDPPALIHFAQAAERKQRVSASLAFGAGSIQL
jgi:hypothetical protein